MRSTIDAAGRVVVPKAIRDRLDLRGGEEIDIELRDDVVEIRRPFLNIRVVPGEDGRPVLQAPEGTPPMTDEDVRRAIDESREWPRRY